MYSPYGSITILNADCMPASNFWMNLVERFFADLTSDVVREGSFESVRELVADIEKYLADRDEQPKAYCWKAGRQAILEKTKRARQKLEKAKACSYMLFSGPNASTRSRISGRIL